MDVLDADWGDARVKFMALDVFDGMVADLVDATVYGSYVENCA